MHKPSIAQVHGSCLAGGTDLALACDVVIAADDARIGFPAARAMGALPNNLWMYHCGPQWAKRLQLTGDSITGADAAKIGLVLKAVPAGVLEDEVQGLADRFALIDPDLLAANKRITNLALELMGAQTLQRLAGENDARAHRAPAVREYGRSVREHGLKETLRRRDEPFGEGYARVDEPRGAAEPSGPRARADRSRVGPLLAQRVARQVERGLEEAARDAAELLVLLGQCERHGVPRGRFAGFQRGQYYDTSYSSVDRTHGGVGIALGSKRTPEAAPPSASLGSS